MIEQGTDEEIKTSILKYIDTFCTTNDIVHTLEINHDNEMFIVSVSLELSNIESVITETNKRDYDNLFNFCAKMIKELKSR